VSVRFLIGDARAKLKELPDESVHCVVTSPPYFGLRDYGTAQWEGGDPACDHRESSETRTANSAAASTLGGGKGNTHRSHAFGRVCGKCGARCIDSQIGLEATPAAYVAELVAVFREVRRVLRSDGTVWLNVGDSYSAQGGGKAPGLYEDKRSDGATWQAPRKPVGGLKPKDLIGIPWRLAFALQEDGWWLRQDIIWSKANPMPESVTDRCTKSHEYVFLLTKSASYAYDAEAIKEPNANPESPECVKHWSERSGNGEWEPGTGGRMGSVRNGRNKRSVWTIATEPSSLGHFALMPTALAELCVRSGSSERGCCPKCGAGWVRLTEEAADDRAPYATVGAGVKAGGAGRNDATGLRKVLREDGRGGDLARKKVTLLGWSASCSCPPHEPGPATVLDCFAGAGTTGLVADRLGRNAILIELNPAYAVMARTRLEADAGMFACLEAAE
jgi:DNA modification methylase